MAANQKNHDASTNKINDYFADRFHTEKIVKDKEYFIAKSCQYCKTCLKWHKLQTYRREFKKKGFRHLTKMLNIG